MTQTIPIQFQSVQEGSDPKALPPGTMLAAENCRIDKARRLRKRGGTDALPRTILGGAGGVISAGARLYTTADGEIGCIDGTSAYVFVEALQQWRFVDYVSPFRAEQWPLVGGVYGVSCVDVALYNDIWLVSVWQFADPSVSVDQASFGTSKCFFQVHDVRTWALVKGPTNVNTGDDSPANWGSRPKVRIVGSKATFFWIKANTISASQLDLTTLILSSPTAIETTSQADYQFDVTDDGSNFILFCCLNAGGNRIHLRRLSSALASIATLEWGGVIDTGSYSMSVSCDADYIYCTYTDITNTRLSLATIQLNLSAPLIVTGAFVASVTCNLSFAEPHNNGTSILVGYQDKNEGSPFTTFLVAKTTTVIDTSSTRQSYDLRDCRRPIMVDGRWYTDVAVYSWDQNFTLAPVSRVMIEIRVDGWSGQYWTGVALANDTPCHHQVATLENLTGWLQVSAWSYLGRIARASDGTLYMVSMRRLEEGPKGTTRRAAAYINKLTKKGDRFKTLRAGNVQMMLGATPMLNDDQKITPYGFTHAPMIQSTSDNGSGGSMAKGTYRYMSCFIHVDARGVKHRSMMSAEVDQAASVNSDLLRVNFATTSVSGKASEEQGLTRTPTRVIVEIYRSTVNGEILYRMSHSQTNNAQNVCRLYTVQFSDTRADALYDGEGNSLSLQPQIYTTVETDDVPPPAALAGTTHRNRFIVIDSSGHVVWASKDASEDLEVAPGFNEAFVMQFAQRKVAALSLDEKLILWGEKDIHVVQGEGPDAFGSGGSWDITQLQSDVGCMNSRSVVPTPMGALFQSDAGLQMLSRDLAVSRIGKAIEDTLSDFPWITSAVLVEEEHEVRFTCNNAETSPTQGIVLAWDYLYGAWFVRRYMNTMGATSIPFADALVVDDTYCLLGTDGTVYRETFAHFKDCGTYWVTRDIQMAPFEPSGNGLGWSRVRDVTMLGTSLSAHRLEVSAAIDFDTWSQVETFDETDEACVVGATNKAKVTFAEQKCQALQLRIRDLAPAVLGTGEGPMFEALAFRADVFRGPVRTSDGESA